MPKARGWGAMSRWMVKEDPSEERLFDWGLTRRNQRCENKRDHSRQREWEVQKESWGGNMLGVPHQKKKKKKNARMARLEQRWREITEEVTKSHWVGWALKKLKCYSKGSAKPSDDTDYEKFQIKCQAYSKCCLNVSPLPHADGQWV